MMPVGTSVDIERPVAVDQHVVSGDIVSISGVRFVFLGVVRYIGGEKKTFLADLTQNVQSSGVFYAK